MVRDFVTAIEYRHANLVKSDRCRKAAAQIRSHARYYPSTETPSHRAPVLGRICFGGANFLEVSASRFTVRWNSQTGNISWKEREKRLSRVHIRGSSMRGLRASHHGDIPETTPDGHTRQRTRAFRDFGIDKRNFMSWKMW